MPSPRLELYRAVRRAHPEWVVTWWTDGTVTAQEFADKLVRYKGELQIMVKPHGDPVVLDPDQYQWNADEYFAHTAMVSAPIQWAEYGTEEH